MCASRALPNAASHVLYISCLYLYIIPTESLVYWKENEERRRSRSIGAAAELRYLDFDWSEEHSRSMMIGCLEIYKVFCEQARQKNVWKVLLNKSNGVECIFYIFYFFPFFSHHTSHDAATFSSQQQHHHRRALGQFDFFSVLFFLITANPECIQQISRYIFASTTNSSLLQFIRLIFCQFREPFFCSCDLCAL